MEKIKKVSVIIPCKNEEKSIQPLFERLTTTLKSISIEEYEILFINDGSSDKTLQEMHAVKEQDGRVKVIEFTRNFGKASALNAGFIHSTGDVIITMDGDLQDEPNEIPRFIKKIEEGYDLVTGWKFKRFDPWHKTLPSRLFNWIIRIFTKVKLYDCDSGFKAIRRKVIDNIKVYEGLYRHIPVYAAWKGFKVTEIKVKHNKRKWGTSKYGASRFIKGIFDLLTMIFLVKFMKRPMHFFGTLSLLTGIPGFLFAAYLTFRRIVFQELIGTRPLLLLAVFLMIMSIQFISIGLIGEMITNESHKRKEEFVIKEIK